MSTTSSLSTALELKGIPPDLYAAQSKTHNPNPAHEAYDEAVKQLRESLTEDECKRIWLKDKTNIEQVQQAVNTAKEAYEVRSQQSKARKWLTRFSENVMHYAKVMDTLANYNPEYCALAWGTMKFLLMAVLNHEEYITQISKAFSQIGAALPRVNVKLLLFPTEQMQHAISKQYAQVLKFMLRAVKWYTEGKLKHFVTAVFKPAALRFQDILEGIESCSHIVDQLAVGASQAEQRNMHVLLREILRTTMAETRRKTLQHAVVGLLRSMKIPVVWVLSAKSEGNLHWRSPIDVLKQLVLQVLTINQSLLNDPSPDLNAARFQTAATESDWFVLLSSVLEGLSQIYIVIEAEVLSREFCSQISWPDAFSQLFDNLAANCKKAIIKVVLVSFGNSPCIESASTASLECVTIKLDNRRRAPPGMRKKLQFRSPTRRESCEILRPFLLQSVE